MKKSILFLACVIVSSYAFGDNKLTKPNYWERDGDGAVNLTNMAATQPTQYEIVKTMLDHADAVSGNLAQVIVSCAESKKANTKIEVDFEKPLYDELNRIVVWHVWTTFQCNEPDSETFYTCGVDFFMRDDTREPIRETFRKYGVC